MTVLRIAVPLAAARSAPLHLNPLGIAVVVIVLAAAWAVRARIWPYGKCPRCGGTGKNRGSTGQRWGKCRRCKGSGTRQRLGTRPVQKVLGRKRDG
jgi:hypothetical protein